MIQDIYPKHLDNHFVECEPQDNDIVFLFEGSSVLARPDETFDAEHPENGVLTFPRYEQFIMGITSSEGANAVDNYAFIYLFAVDDMRFFLAQKSGKLQKGQLAGEQSDAAIHSEYGSIIDGFEFIGVNSFRKARPKEMAFAAITAYHLNGWYRDNHFCGRCGKPMIHDHKERMVKCEHCGNMVFPKICPAVIVGVTDGDRILLTKYAGRNYKNYALVAGFTEIGETVEETVKREVMEEVGLKVKNITYYKSQPWALSGSLLMGYFCQLDGDDTIRLEEDELSVGTWVKAEELELEDDEISLTREMILEFKKRHMK